MCRCDARQLEEDYGMSWERECGNRLSHKRSVVEAATSQWRAM